DTDYVVVSSAIKDNNPEIIRARKLGIKILKRAEFLADISFGKRVIAVAGCHGKTTTTGMITSIFEFSKIPHTAVIGGILKNVEDNALYRGDDYFIIEADESDGTFLHYSPLVSCITNIDSDHLDYYKTTQAIKKAFIEFINKTPYYGMAVICGDDPNIKSIKRFLTAPTYTYGFDKGNIWSVKFNGVDKGKTIFEIFYKGKKDAKISLSVFGRHNILNAASAYIASRYLGVDKKKIKQGLENFKGMKRRLDLIKKIDDIYFYDDYAHHPSEIKATLLALKNLHPHFKIIAIFQPHRYSRSAYLIDEFSLCFDKANELYVMDIYPSGEENAYGITSEKIIERISHKHPSVHKFIDSLSIVKKLKPKTIVVSLGAGDVYKTILDISLKYESLIKEI
ncbi:MAG: UDP-N-acetylmuramate--L-alanine ligase, partial [Elusimicrobiales bacterium]